MTRVTRGAFALPGSSLDYKTGNWREQIPVHRHWVAPCHGGCPAGEDPQAYIAHVQEGRNRLAWETLVAANPFPAIMGRVCPHPCESGCNRGQFDQPVAIHSIERMLGDEAIAQKWPLPMPKVAQREAVAVVGAGPAGLSAAYHLRRLGFAVTIFDQNTEPGGMLRYAIPPYRLPRDILDAEIDRLMATGINFQPRMKLGRDMHLDELRQRFAAVFLGPGCQMARPWSVDGVGNDRRAHRPRHAARVAELRHRAGRRQAHHGARWRQHRHRRRARDEMGRRRRSPHRRRVEPLR